MPTPRDTQPTPAQSAPPDRRGSNRTTLGELAKLIRSKNAGPFTLTFDVMFEEEDTYRRVLRSGVLTRAVFAELYHLPEEEVMFFHHDAARAIKISIPRPAIQGDRDDGDMYGGQQHAPLVGLEMPD